MFATVDRISCSDIQFKKCQFKKGKLWPIVILIREQMAGRIGLHSPSLYVTSSEYAGLLRDSGAPSVIDTVQ